MSRAADARVPVPLSSLVGREEAVATVVALLHDPAARLITLTGPGGVGKTRLALRVAAEVADAFADGVDFIELASIHEAGMVIPAIARALGVLRSNAEPALDSLKAALRVRNQLLVLDNVEHVIDAAPAISSLLEACPRVSALVTSRALLSLAGERGVPVPPLTLPANLDGSVAACGNATAVRLFVERSQAVQPGFALTAANAAAIAGICARLDGLPLAIELAAAHSTMLSPAALLDRLERRLPLLTGGARNLPDRQRTMRDTIAWSYALLSPFEQIVFRRLSVFTGGCSIEAAEAVCDPGSGDDEAAWGTTVQAIESLVRQALVQTAPAPDQPGTSRLTMLETVREFAAGELAGGGDTDASRRHADFYLALASQAATTFWGDAPGNWRATLDIESGNLRTALAWAIDNGKTDIALRLAGALFDPYWLHDLRWLNGDDGQRQRQWVQRALAMPGGTLASRVAALTSAACLAEAQGELAECHDLLDQAHNAACTTGDGLGAATVAFFKGRIAYRQDHPGAARDWLTTALDGFRAHGARGRAALTCCFLAALDSRLAIDEGADPADLERALRLCEEALAAFREVDYLPGIMRAVHGIATVAYKQRDLVRSLALYHQVLALAWEQNRMVHAYLADIADIAGRVGEPGLAARLYGASIAQRRRRNSRQPPTFRAELEREMAVAREALGEQAFAVALAEGEAMPLEQAVADALAFSEGGHRASRIQLTPREREILPMLAQGLTAREIGVALYLSHRTVERHIAGICARFGVHSRAEAVVAARSAGFLPGQPRS